MRKTRPRQFGGSQEHCMQYLKRYANKLFFNRMFSLAPLSTSLIHESQAGLFLSTFQCIMSCQFAEPGHRTCDIKNTYKVTATLVLHFG